MKLHCLLHVKKIKKIKIAIIKYLVEHGADINKANFYIRETPLYYACENGNKSIIKYLVEHGADVNKSNGYGRTPLFNACTKKKK